MILMAWMKYINPRLCGGNRNMPDAGKSFPRKTEAYTIDVAMTADRARRIGDASG